MVGQRYESLHLNSLEARFHHLLEACSHHSLQKVNSLFRNEEEADKSKYHGVSYCQAAKQHFAISLSQRTDKVENAGEGT